MKLRYLATILACSVAAPCIAHAASLEKLKNEKVVVTEITLAPGQKESWNDRRPSLLTFLGGDSVSISEGPASIQKETVKRGETQFLPGDVAAIENAGRAELRLVRIGFLNAGSDQTWGHAGLAPNYEILSENRYARIYDIKIPAHGREPQHTHHARVVICLSGAKLEHILPDGTVQPSTLQTGDIAWRSGGTHVGHNLGDTDLWVIAVEPK